MPAPTAGAKLYLSTAQSWQGDIDVQEALRITTTRYLEAYFENRRLIYGLLQMAATNTKCAELWWNLRESTHDRMEKHIPPVLNGRGDPKLVASALASMVEQFAYHWYVEADREGREVPGCSEAAFVLSQIWYRAVYANQRPEEIALGARVTAGGRNTTPTKTHDSQGKKAHEDRGKGKAG